MGYGPFFLDHIIALKRRGLPPEAERLIEIDARRRNLITGLGHAQARRDWGYAADEVLSNDEMIAEKYRGIRPAFGYPACPDHTETRALFDLPALVRKSPLRNLILAVG